MNNYINLIDKLSKLDKERLINYINAFGVSRKNFIGLDKWLQNWSHSNQYLYKLLGNQFIQKFDYEFKKDNDLLNIEIENLLQLPFKKSYHQFYWIVLKKMDNIDTKTMRGFSKVTDIKNFIDDKVYVPIKYKRRDRKQTLQIQAGMKPMRALQKIILYFEDLFDFEEFEDFRLKHSKILNDKFIKGTACISIHPLDFLTMSDNDSNWSSCMSWDDDGCYCVGSIEMMNSNNVLCCYLENSNPFVFTTNPNDINEKKYCWNNKKWRQLVYITKDIIMSGKPYPYKNIHLSKQLISEIKKLAEKNLHWNYTYGPERYLDMIHVNNKFAMDQNRNWIKYKNTTKHNIIWDTKGMYNDMLNDNKTEYWCFRNKVKRNKIISVSGKAPCLCCGKSILKFNEFDYNALEDIEEFNEYNERYENTGNLICEECMDSFHCYSCNDSNPKLMHYLLTNNDKKIYQICEMCFQTKIKICPDCGKFFHFKFSENTFGIFIKDMSKPARINYEFGFDDNESTEKNFALSLYCCPECIKNKIHNNDVEAKRIHYIHGIYHNELVVKENFDYKKYLRKNLKSAPLPDKDATDTLEVIDVVM